MPLPCRQCTSACGSQGLAGCKPPAAQTTEPPVPGHRWPLGSGGGDRDGIQGVSLLPPSFLSCHPTFPGDVLFQMAEVHRQIQNQLEEMVSPSLPLWASGEGAECQLACGRPGQSDVRTSVQCSLPESPPVPAGLLAHRSDRPPFPMGVPACLCLRWVPAPPPDPPSRPGLHVGIDCCCLSSPCAAEVLSQRATHAAGAEGGAGLQVPQCKYLAHPCCTASPAPLS